MRHHLKKLFFVAVLSIATSTPAQPPTDPALDLARLLMSRDATLYDDADINRFQARILGALLASPGACNPFLSACQSAAASVAAQYAPALRDAQRARSERQTAEALARTMSPAEMAHVAAWLRADEGRHFLDAWAALRDPDAVSRRRRDLERDSIASSPDIMNPALAQFRQRTRNLPQPAPR